MNAFDTLLSYLSARGATFTDDERTTLHAAFVPTALAAGEFTQRAGEPARHAMFVAAGCMRIYVVDANGKEHILQFLPEEWWWADTVSLNTGAPSQYSSIVRRVPQWMLASYLGVSPETLSRIRKNRSRRTVAKRAGPERP